TKVKQRARKWYGQGLPGLPPRKRVPLASDKTVARRMLTELVRKGELGEAGFDAKAAEARLTSLAAHLDDWKVALEVKGTGDKQGAEEVEGVGDRLNGCGFAYPQDVSAQKVAEYLAARRRLPRRDGGIGVQTSNFYLQAVGQFCKWMVRRKRMAANPMVGEAA